MLQEEASCGHAGAHSTLSGYSEINARAKRLGYSLRPGNHIWFCVELVGPITPISKKLFTKWGFEVARSVLWVRPASSLLSEKGRKIWDGWKKNKKSNSLTTSRIWLSLRRFVPENLMTPFASSYRLVVGMHSSRLACTALVSKRRKALLLVMIIVLFMLGAKKLLIQNDVL